MCLTCLLNIFILIENEALEFIDIINTSRILNKKILFLSSVRY